MTKVNIKEYEVTTHKNKGINKEHSLCNYFGIEREKHDSKAYNVASDIEINGMRISVKSPEATLMSASLCGRCTTFRGIWDRYRKNTHSDTIAFITHDYDVYFMTIAEFSRFIHKFGYIAHESSSRMSKEVKNGGLKIRIRDNKKSIAWLDARVA